MTDSKKLRHKVAESGLKLKFLAEKLGITYQAFLKKLNNESEFKASEIQCLCELLRINLKEKELIFFAQFVE